MAECGTFDSLVGGVGGILAGLMKSDRKSRERTKLSSVSVSLYVAKAIFCRHFSSRIHGKEKREKGR